MATLYGSFARIDLTDGVLVAMADATTVRVCPVPDASTRADLAADVARLERGVADLTRERDGLRSRLDGQAAHRAAGEGVDLRRYVLRADVVAALEADAASSDRAAGIARSSETSAMAYRSCARVTRDIAARFRGDLRSEAVEGGEHKGVEGGDHGATVATDAAGRKGPTL